MKLFQWKGDSNGNGVGKRRTAWFFRPCRHRRSTRFILFHSLLRADARCKIATKKALLHMSYDTWDKTESSCGTTHIGALRPLIPRTVMRAALVTGAVPVSSY